MIRYSHTQFGWVIVVGLLLAGCGIPIWILSVQVPKDAWAIVGAALIPGAITLFGILILFYNLKTTITDKDLNISFGVGLIKKNIPLESIRACEVKKRQFILGWGIRLGDNYTLWNVSGFDAVELTFKVEKRKFRIGSDRPEELCNAINSALGAQAP